MVVVKFCPSSFTHQEQETVEISADVDQLTDQLTIRPVEPTDLKNLCEVLANCFYSPEGLMAWVYPLLKLGIYEDLRSRLRSPSSHYLCLVALVSMAGDKSNTNVSGTVEMTLRSASPTMGSVKRPYIANLAVGKPYRRRGIASKLLKHCERTAQSWGFTEIYLHVLDNNSQARQLYGNCGYHLYRVESSYLGDLWGRPKRLLLHKIIIDNPPS